MARVTVEDCIEQVPNRFELVQIAAIRAKQLKKGANPMLPTDENKAVVVALREIAEGLISPDLEGPEVYQDDRAIAGALDEEVVDPEPIAPPVASEPDDRPQGGSS